ncbi:DUF1080 domain-containing protein [Mariniblastus sp.]|nr:DUF1080 domain-containing protein [Mariniblastus sp.]
MSKPNTFLAIAIFLLVGTCGTPVLIAQSGTTTDPVQTPHSDSGKTEFASDDPGFKPMFTEDSFEGWVQLGGKAKYEIKDGVVTGTCVPGEPNSFMATGMDYTNFEMDVEFKVDAALNSGIQIRSECFANKTEFKLDDGKIRKIAAGRVHGYQVEIDPSEKMQSGGIYDEARRRWLVKPNEDAASRDAFKPNQWNHMRIKCDGDHIQSWINGVARSAGRVGMIMICFLLTW